MFNLGKEHFEYDIEQITEDEYELKLTYKFNHNFMMDMLKKSMTKVEKKLGRNIELIEDQIEEFTIPDNYKPHFFKILRTSLLKDIRKLKKEFMKDGFRIVTYEIKEAVYTKISRDKWKSEILLGGICSI